MRSEEFFTSISVMVSDQNDVVLLGGRRWAEEGDRLALSPNFIDCLIDIRSGGMLIGIAPLEEAESIRTANHVFAGWVDGIHGIRAVEVDISWG